MRVVFSLFLAKINSMIVVTGAAGFIGSILVAKLNSLGYENLILVDDFSKINKEKNPFFFLLFFTPNIYITS